MITTSQTFQEIYVSKKAGINMTLYNKDLVFLKMVHEITVQ